MYYSLNSLKGGYIGDHIGDTRSLDYGLYVLAVGLQKFGFDLMNLESARFLCAPGGTYQLFFNVCNIRELLPSFQTC